MIETKEKITLLRDRVAAGFPSPAEGDIEEPLNLHRYIVRHPPSTFFVRAYGESMIDAGIFSGDILVVDRSLEAVDKCIVIAVLDGEFTVKRLSLRKGKITLRSDNSSFPDFSITEIDNFTIWGVVTHSIRNHFYPEPVS